MRALLSLPLLLVLVATSSCGFGEPKRVSPPDEPRYCTQRYTLEDGRVPLCASLPLDEAALARLEGQLHEVRALYPRFAAACGVELEGMPPALKLHVVRYEELNDRAVFPRDERVGNILGRYYVRRGVVFVTERALTDEGNFHLPHELAHWLQDHAGVDDAEEDERLARAFHRFYRSQASARPLLAELTLTKRFGLERDALLMVDDGRGAPASERSLVEGTAVATPPFLDELCGRSPAPR